MKIYQHLLQKGGPVLAAFAVTGFAEEPVMRDAITHDQLVLKLRKAEQSDPMKILKLTKGEDPTVAHPPKSLLGESDILSFGGLATLVPKHAILQIPKNFSARLKIEAGAKIVSWADFYSVNRGWITTVDINRLQAEGNQPLPEKTRKLMTQCRNLMVATYQGGPISVLPAKLADKSAVEPVTPQS
jgi:hypothetical protein